MKILLIALALIGLIAGSVEAQVIVPAPFTGATVQLYAPGVDPVAGTPTATTPATAFACNIAGPMPIVVNPLVNPKTIYFDDQVNVGRFCVATIATNLPTNTGYVATVTGIWSGGTTGRSAASNPFNTQPIQVPPTAPTGLAVRP